MYFTPKQMIHKLLVPEILCGRKIITRFRKVRALNRMIPVEISFEAV